MSSWKRSLPRSSHVSPRSGAASSRPTSGPAASSRPVASSGCASMTASRRPSERSSPMPTRAHSSWKIPARRVASGGSTRPRSSTSASRPTPTRPGCNEMARPVFGRARPPEEGGSRVSHLDRDRALVDAARADPAQFDALYRRYLAQIYSYAYYELGDHHEAEDATE